ncbi:MAG: Hsp20/alpha crystallin family protein [Candidatus Micrarchaeota archaeon]|nr:Hsp20/alpha crystallin family protein [Candidatus Micrarchaeota archaeon]
MADEKKAGLQRDMGDYGSPANRYQDSRTMIVSSPLEKDPLIEVMESKDYVSVMAEMPQGATKLSIKLVGRGAQLEVDAKGSRKNMSRLIMLPTNVSFRNAAAKFNNGVLEVLLPKSEKAEGPRMIQIA